MQNATAVAAVAAALAITLLPASAHRPVFNTHEIIINEGDLFDGIAYPAGTLVRVREGTKTVVNIRLNSDFEMNGHVILAGSRLYVPAGKLTSYFTVKGQTINGIVLPKDSQLAFDGHGKLQMIISPGAVKIGGKTYRAHNWVQFGANGEVIPTEANYTNRPGRD